MDFLKFLTSRKPVAVTLLFTLILLTPLISANTFGYNYLDNQPTGTINNTYYNNTYINQTLELNTTQFETGEPATIKTSWLNTFIEAVSKWGNFVPYTGADQDVDLGANNLTTIGNINVGTALAAKLSVKGSDGGTSWGGYPAVLGLETTDGFFSYIQAFKDGTNIIGWYLDIPNTGGLNFGGSAVDPMQSWNYNDGRLKIADGTLSYDYAWRGDKVEITSSHSTYNLLGLKNAITDTKYWKVDKNLNTWTPSNINIDADNKKLILGDGQDSSIYYDATNLIINPKEVGSGYLSVLGDVDLGANSLKQGASSQYSQHFDGANQRFDLTTGNFVFNNGNVGIGTTNPTRKLDVSGNIRSTNTITADTLTANRFTGVKNRINSFNTNLGTPSVEEMALFKGQFNNKLRFQVPDLQEESNDGVTWTTSTKLSADELGNLMVGDGHQTSTNKIIISPTVAGNDYHYRLTYDAVSYRFLNQLYMYMQTEGIHVTIKIEAYEQNTDTWHEIATGTANGWPTHVHIPHTRFNFAPQTTVESYRQKARVTFSAFNVPSTHITRNIRLGSLEWWGGFPAQTRDVYTIDRNRRIIFPTDIRINDNQKAVFGTGNDASITYDGTNLVFNTQEGGSGIAYFSNNVSATGFITRTSVYDKSRGMALDLIKDSSELVDSKGDIKHEEFYGYTQFETTDFSKPVNVTKVREICDVIEDEKTFEQREVCFNETYYEIEYPHKKLEDGVDLGKEINLLTQALVEIRTIFTNLLNRMTGAEERITNLEAQVEDLNIRLSKLEGVKA